MNVGEHVWARFWTEPEVQVVILQLKGDEALVQELGTQRAEWLPVANLHR